MYTTLNSAIYDLRKRGYRLNFFHHQFDFVTYLSNDRKIPFNKFEIDEMYEFPSLNKDGSQSILYAVKAPDGLRGILFDYVYDFKENTETVKPKLQQKNSNSKWIETY